MLKEGGEAGGGATQTGFLTPPPKHKICKRGGGTRDCVKSTQANNRKETAGCVPEKGEGDNNDDDRS